MPKNIVICCDGTGNEVSNHLSNVLKLYRIVERNEKQLVYYDPGIGTLSSSDAWFRFKNEANTIFGLLTGYGLDQNILDAYDFLIDTYEEGDQVYFFGFSRGAYTVRALGGFLQLVGLLKPEQKNLSNYALTAYKKVAEGGDFEVAWRFARVLTTERVPIHFIGVWDTVSSVIVPRPDRFYVPSLQTLPYTARNPLVRAFRHAIAIDERRQMFDVNRWTEGQVFQPNPFGSELSQDIKQVWFAGNHSDVGGGYPEAESGLAKFPLSWLILEAKAHGLRINTGMFNHLIMGQPRAGATRTYVPPNVTAQLHDSMTGAWKLVNAILPGPGLRFIPQGALVHWSVIERIAKVTDYKSKNIPAIHTVEGSAPVPATEDNI
jgi:uncharacterized protein (DUF2235 family)